MESNFISNDLRMNKKLDVTPLMHMLLFALEV